MNVLEIVKSVCYSEGASAIPSSLLENTFNANQFKNWLLDESRFLRSQNVFPQCKKRVNFTVESGRIDYPLPADYYAPLTATQWDTSNRWQLIGPLSDSDFRYRQLGYASFDNRRAYRVFGGNNGKYTTGGQFQIDPSPGTSGDTLSFEYVSKNLFTPPAWTPTTVIAALSYIYSNGNIYYTTAGGTTGTTPPSATSAVPVDGTVTWVYQDIAYEDIVTDTDLSMFDDEVLISGIKWRYQKSKGIAFDIDPNTGVPVLHMKILQAAVTRWLGSYKVSLAQSGFNTPMPNVAEGSWNL